MIQITILRHSYFQSNSFLLRLLFLLVSLSEALVYPLFLDTLTISKHINIDTMFYCDFGLQYAFSRFTKFTSRIVYFDGRRWRQQRDSFLGLNLYCQLINEIDPIDHSKRTANRFNQSEKRIPVIQYARRLLTVNWM